MPSCMAARTSSAAARGHKLPGIKAHLWAGGQASTCHPLPLSCHCPQGLLDDIQGALLAQARAFRDENIVDVASYDELKQAVAAGEQAAPRRCRACQATTCEPCPPASCLSLPRPALLRGPAGKWARGPWAGSDDDERQVSAAAVEVTGCCRTAVRALRTGVALGALWEPVGASISMARWCDARALPDPCPLPVARLATGLLPQVKEDTSATLRCIPFDQPQHSGTCFFTGQPASEVAIFAKAY